MRVIVAASDLGRYVRLLNGRHHKCHLKNISTSLTKIFALNTILFRYDGNNLCLVSGDLAAAAVLVYSLLVIKPPTRRPCPKLHLISPLPLLSATISDCRSCAICKEACTFYTGDHFPFHMLFSQQPIATTTDLSRSKCGHLSVISHSLRPKNKQFITTFYIALSNHT